MDHNKRKRGEGDILKYFFHGKRKVLLVFIQQFIQIHILTLRQIHVQNKEANKLKSDTQSPPPKRFGLLDQLDASG